MPPQPATAAASPRRPRDLRLDFFRGIAMFIILLAHTPGNTWTLWIPARFGFSDATEIFVFCSGMASALAFGTVFAQKSWFLGSARIAFRVYQVYWAHIGVFLFTALTMVAVDATGLGRMQAEEGYSYATWFPVDGVFTRPKETLVGLFTLTYIPGLFDILPMYLVILAMVPLVMLAHRFGGRAGVAAFVIGVWLAANLAGYARMVDRMEEPTAWQTAFAALGAPFLWMNLPGIPWEEGAIWFFNPFGWQLIFFTGFAFGMGWLPAPPVDRRLIWAAAAFVLLTIPFAWFKIHGGFYLPDDWAVQNWIAAVRDFIQPFWWKSWEGLGRYLHFLALGYLAWVAVGPGGVKLREGFRAPAPPSRPWLIATGAIALLTAPWAYAHELGLLIPGFAEQIAGPLDAGDQAGLIHLTHLGALLVFAYGLLTPDRRAWLCRAAFLRTVPVIRKVGTQSLPVFIVSIVLARFNGWLLDVAEHNPEIWGVRDVWSRAIVNLWGFAVLIGTAYFASWFKAQPWRRDRASVTSEASETGPRPAGPPPSARETQVAGASA